MKIKYKATGPTQGDSYYEVHVDGVYIGDVLRTDRVWVHRPHTGSEDTSWRPNKYSTRTKAAEALQKYQEDQTSQVPGYVPDQGEFDGQETPAPARWALIKRIRKALGF